MSGKDEGGGLFRRMARKVTAPARELVGMAARDTEARATEFDKAEMKAMIERKRRNDYVRKRELDTLRRIRREGLSGEQAQALTMQSSRLDDTETRSTPSSVPTSGIKAKIDAIERQMVGASGGVSAGSGTRPGSLPPPPPPRLPPGPPPPILTTTIFDTNEADGTPTVPVPLSKADDHDTAARLDGEPLQLAPRGPDNVETAPVTLPAAAFHAALPEFAAPPTPVAAPVAPLEFTPTPMPAPQPAPTRPAPPSGATVNLGGGESVEVSHVLHDETLDEAVIAFAGGDFQACERSLQALVAPRGERRDHDETWLVLFDFYRAIGQQAKFEALTMEYVERFHRSAPQWFSLPRMLADATAAPQADDGHAGGGIGWVCPATLDADAVTRLDAQSMQLPMPWVMDWSALTSVDVEGAGRLQKLFAGWANQALTMQWIAGERLLSVLQDIAPTGVRDADPVYWMLRLEALRLTHRPDQFDEVAIDYCMTYEVSPPSWESARCTVRMGSSTGATAAQMSHVSEVSTGFVESEIDGGGAMVAAELAGQLVGDISGLLKSLEQKLGTASMVNVSCAKLIRIDFIAAGDLLNWVLARRSENRAVNFDDANRLVALFCGAMGINEHARVKVRNI